MDEAVFAIGTCVPCGRTVLTAIALRADGSEERRCVHCDAALDPDELSWVDEAALEGVGYVTWTEAETCGRPDCGGGKCGR